MGLYHDEMLFLAKHYAPSRIRVLAAIDEAMKSIDENSILAIAADTRRKIANMTDEQFDTLAVEEWAMANDIVIIWECDGLFGAACEK